MSLFSSLDISATGVDAMQSWIDMSAGNIANADDAVSTTGTPYEAQSPVFSALPGSDGGPGDGVSASVALDTSGGTVEPDPGNPIADAQGNVRVPDVSLSDQMVNMMSAQDDYQANTTAISNALAAYHSGLTIGT